MEDKNSVNSDLMEFDPDMNLEQESLRSRILDAVMDGADEEAVRAMLDDYEQQYGQDLFWKMTSFDQAEVNHDLSEMKRMLDLMETEDISKTMRHVCAARVCYCQEDFEGALAELNQVETLEDNEESLVFLHLKGLICYGLKRYEEAAACMEDIMLDVEDEQVAGITGICYLHLGKTDRAREYLDKMTSKDAPGSYDWLYELLSNFNDLKIIEHPAFPEEVRKAIQSMFYSDASLAVTDMEDMIADNPGVFLPVLKEMAKCDLPDPEVIYYLLGICYNQLDREKEARKWLRKALRQPITQPSRLLEPGTSTLQIRLLALSLLNYSAPVQLRYCREFMHNEFVSSSDLIDLIFFGAFSSLPRLVEDILSEDGVPVTEDSFEERKLHHALLYHFYTTGQMRAAMPQAQLLYKDGTLIDPVSILITAYLFWIFGEPRPEASTKRDDYVNLRLYLIDQLITLEQMRLDDNVTGFRRKIIRMYQERKNDDDPGWEIFDDFSELMVNELDNNPKMRSAAREMRRLMKECQQ